MLCVSCLNKLVVVTKETKQFSNPQVLSSTLTALGILQPQAFGLLNRLVPLVLESNYYIVEERSTCQLLRLNSNIHKTGISLSVA